jgi:hypothetical protein
LSFGRWVNQVVDKLMQSIAWLHLIQLRTQPECRV